NTATIESGITGGTATAGLVKVGAGTLQLRSATGNNFAGGTTINEGIVNITNDNQLGASTGTLTLNGGTIQFANNLDIGSARTISIGANGGTIDTNGFSTIAGYGSGTGIVGGVLTKIGGGEFYTASNSGYTGLVIKRGTFK